MIPVRPVHLRKKDEAGESKEKVYSYHEVERLVLNAIKILKSSELLKEGGIEIKCFPDPAQRGVRFDIRKGDRGERAIVFIERG